MSEEWENNKDRIYQRIIEFKPTCIKCGYDLGHIVAEVNGLLCPKCKYNMIDSAIQQVDLHFKGYNVPPMLISMFKQGIKEEGLK